MSDEEDDYMSDMFLQNDTKPGLMPKIFKEKHLRKEVGKKRSRENKTKPLKIQEAEKRDEKLNKALDESNKGFALLSKMGFKKGMGLGKDGQGRVVPIPVNLKSGRKGLGTEESEKRKKQKMQMANEMRAKQRKMAEHNLKDDFTNRLRKKQSEYQLERDLDKSQKCCEQLDSTKNLEKPFPWAWPPVVLEDDEKEEEGRVDDEEYETEDLSTQLDLLTNYLRTMHKYCVWCGTSYNDENDLNDSCPGGTYEDHDEL